MFTKLIERNTAILFNDRGLYHGRGLPADGQHPRSAGERPMARDNSRCRFELIGIPPARRGIPKVEVSFEVDVNGILSVSARDLDRNVQTVRVRPTSGLSSAISKGSSRGRGQSREDDKRQEVAN